MMKVETSEEGRKKIYMLSVDFAEKRILESKSGLLYRCLFVAHL